MHKSSIMKLVTLMKKVYTNLPLLALAKSVLSGIYPFISIVLSAMIIDSLIEGKDMNYIIMLIAITVGSNFVVAIIRDYLNKIFQSFINNAWHKSHVVETEVMLNIDYEQLEAEEINQLKQKAWNVQNVGYSVPHLSHTLSDFISSLTLLVIGFFIVINLFRATVLNIQNNIFFVILILSIIIAVSIIIIMSNIYQAKFNKYFNSEQIHKSNQFFMYLYYKLLNNHKNGKDIRIYNMQKTIKKNKHYDFFRYDKSEIELGKFGGLNGGVSIALTAIIGILVYIYTASNAINGIISVGQIVLYAGAIQQLIKALCDSISKYMEIDRGVNNMAPVFELLNLKSEMYHGTLPVEKRNDNDYEIEFRNVSYKYDNMDEFAIKNLSFKFNIGEKIAIVGKNGAGKSTFAKLLCRLYDPCEGSIHLNGIDIKKFDYTEYLSIFSAVFQDFQTFALTISDYVTNTKDYDKDKLKKALKDANLLDRVMVMENKFDNYIFNYFDEKGIEISGGEAQKLAIARALYKDTPFIILDEPTASLDPISEYEVYSNFNNLVKDKTTIYISHRLSSCRFCDNILVFENGSIIQSGNHENLVADENSQYYALWNAQAQYYRQKGIELV